MKQILRQILTYKRKTNRYYNYLAFVLYVYTETYGKMGPNYVHMFVDS